MTGYSWNRLLQKHRNTFAGLIANHKWVLLVLVVAFIAYVYVATYSGLWFDEGIEYYYSKVAFGSVPGGLQTVNMLERIRSTYQPPLYNVLMHVWLILFDSELGFRMAGIIVTLIGGVGIYKALCELSNGNTLVGASGTMVYLFSSGVAYYALECAEYNLVLCTLSWALYFFAKLLQSFRKDNLILFAVACCLAIYSQYGAVFAIIGMGVALLVKVIRDSDWVSLRMMAITMVIALVFAILPLCSLFLMPQLLSQGTVGVEHSFVLSYHTNVVIDIVVSLAKCIRWLFAVHSIFVLPVFIIISFGCIVAVVPIRWCKQQRYMFLSIIVMFLLYYIAVASSFYGYTDWDRTLGTANTGGRYCLFLLPYVLTFAVLGVSKVIDELKKRQLESASNSRRTYVMVLAIVVIGMLAYGTIQIASIDVFPWKKDAVREVADSWYAHGCKKGRTLVHQWNDATFSFYLTHNDLFTGECMNAVEAPDTWIKDADAASMLREYRAMGYFDKDEFYYVCPSDQSYQSFVEALTKMGYHIEYLYDGESKLLKLSQGL